MEEAVRAPSVRKGVRSPDRTRRFARRIALRGGRFVRWPTIRRNRAGSDNVRARSRVRLLRPPPQGWFSCSGDNVPAGNRWFRRAVQRPARAPRSARLPARSLPLPLTPPRHARRVPVRSDKRRSRGGGGAVPKNRDEAARKALLENWRVRETSRGRAVRIRVGCRLRSLLSTAIAVRSDCRCRSRLPPPACLNTAQSIGTATPDNCAHAPCAKDRQVSTRNRAESPSRIVSRLRSESDMDLAYL